MMKKKWCKPSVKTITSQELVAYIKTAAWSGPTDGTCGGLGR